MRWNLAWILLLISLLVIGSVASAMPNVRVLALFKDKALFEIDGKRRLLVKGKRSPEGVVLVTSSSLKAVVEFDGVEHALTPKMRIGGGYKKARSQEVRILRDSKGHFRTSGTINGRTISFLVDTGATSVAMSESHARQIGLNYKKDGTPAKALTASGESAAYQIQLKSVSVGGIRKQNVRAIVVKGNGPGEVLLGMSFLKGLDMNNQGNLMVLKKIR